MYDSLPNDYILGWRYHSNIMYGGAQQQITEQYQSESKLDKLASLLRQPIIYFLAYQRPLEFQNDQMPSRPQMFQQIEPTLQGEFKDFSVETPTPSQIETPSQKVEELIQQLLLQQHQLILQTQ